jgi:outer membrane protein OmpA-like peptidoglycan-associated protein
VTRYNQRMRLPVPLSVLLPAFALAAEPTSPEILKKLNAQVTPDGILVRFASDSFFQPGKADLSPSAKPAMDDLLALVRLYPECRIRIESHTDSRGSKGFNAKLSQERAQRLKTTLEGRGLNNVYEAKSHGEARPISREDTDAGRAMNRRVDVYVIPRAQKPAAPEPAKTAP